MNPPPPILDGATLIRWSPIDDRDRPIDQCKHYYIGQLQGVPDAVAICEYSDAAGFYIFYCDKQWKTLNDTFHQTLDDAIHQAEFEFEGVSNTWTIL